MIGKLTTICGKPKRMPINTAYINTHAQLEALREEAALAGGQGPRVVIVGPPESGKSSRLEFGANAHRICHQSGTNAVVGRFGSVGQCLERFGHISGRSHDLFRCHCRNLCRQMRNSSQYRRSSVSCIAWFQHQIASRPVSGASR
jgi:hypothetical protein